MDLLLRREIENYVPKDEQERKDKEMMLYYMDTFDDVLTRNNKVCHFTSSAFVVSKDKKRVLMEHHNIYNSWCWEGGHADGERDLFTVAMREVEEETGVDITDYDGSEYACIDILPVLGHVKHGKWVSAHLHLNVAYIFYADDTKPIRNKPDENSAVCWKDIDDVVSLTNELHMVPVYKKLIKMVKES